MINIATGSETFTGYTFAPWGYVKTVFGDTVRQVIDRAPEGTVRVDIYVDNETVGGLWVGTFDLRTDAWDGTNPQVTGTSWEVPA